jgi:sporulation integral membrane protein YlbJ
MTETEMVIKKHRRYSQKAFLRIFAPLFIIAAAFIINFYFSDEIAHSVRSALFLCYEVLIPSIFPFMILADFIFHYADFSALGIASLLFEKLFRIRATGLCAFILGILCGFPLGVKCARDLYTAGAISKEECERLIGFSNNTGPAFLISGVGLGLRGNALEGIILYFCMVLSAIMCGALFGLFSKVKISRNAGGKALKEENFSLIGSIKSAGTGTLNVCAYLTFFSILAGLLKSVLGISYPYAFILPFLEVGSASSILSKITFLPHSLSLSLSAFAVGFSGLCVHLQAAHFLAGTDISMKKYFFMKLLQGVFAFSLCSLLSLALL